MSIPPLFGVVSLRYIKSNIHCPFCSAFRLKSTPFFYTFFFISFDKLENNNLEILLPLINVLMEDFFLIKNQFSLINNKFILLKIPKFHIFVCNLDSQHILYFVANNNKKIQICRKNGNILNWNSFKLRGFFSLECLFYIFKN